MADPFGAHGRCAVCGQIFRLRADGLVRYHAVARGGPQCSGGGKDPAQLALELDEINDNQTTTTTTTGA